MSYLQPIYAVWSGNAEALAADIDELGVTVRQWRNRGEIPSRAWAKIIKAAAAKGAAITLEMFLPPEVKAELPVHGEGHSASVGLNQNLMEPEPEAPPPFAQAPEGRCSSGAMPPTSLPTCAPSSAPAPPPPGPPASPSSRCSASDVAASPEAEAA